MFRKTDLMKAALLICGIAGSIAEAHHSFADFDSTQTTSITGTVKKFEFNNPHAWLWVVVSADNGTSEVYGFESAGPPVLRRVGVTPDTFKIGDRVTIGFHPLKDGRKGGELASATLGDGSKIDLAQKLKQYTAG